MMRILEKVGNSALGVLFPTMCVGCGKEGRYICERCEGFISEAALICPTCQQSSFTGEQHQACKSLYGFDGFSSIWEYEGAVKVLLHHVKYNGITHAMKEVSEDVFKVMVRDKERFDVLLSFLCLKDTLVTYVPMYRKKERYRGFNQAEVFAKEIAKLSGKNVRGILEKTRDTKPQVDLTKEERLYNTKDAFELKYETNSKSEIPKNVVLVDDVWTTGATMKECCKVLKKAGVKEVWGFTIARTP